jgi:hypothetical protein
MIPGPRITNAFAPPTDDSGYRNQLMSNMGVQGPVRRAADGSGRELTLEEQRYMLFGPPQRDVRQDPYASLGIENKILPDAWEGKNNYIRQVLLNLIRGEKSVWVDEILPWRNYDGGNTITLTRVKFADHILDNIPEQGVPRLTIQTHDRTTTTLDRKGLAFHMENGFMMTPQGLEDYAMSILQIQQATVSTACLQVIVALLNAPPRPSNFYGAYHLPIPQPTVKRIFDYEAQTWGMLNVAKEGFLKMQSLGKQALMAHNVVPDTLIIPYNVKVPYTFSHPESTSYMIAGPSGPKRLESDGGTIASQTQMRIVESRPFTYGERDMTFDPTVRERSIGKHFLMSWRFMPKLRANEAHPLECLDIMVMDCESDTVKRIDYWDALAKTGLVGPTRPAADEGTLFDAMCISPEYGRLVADRLRTFGAAPGAQVLEEAPDQFGNDPNVLAALHEANAIALNGENALAEIKTYCHRYGIPSPLEVLLVRPHEIWQMGSAIMLKRGAQTGSTYIGHGDFELGRDVNRKMLMGYYTVYLGAVIEKPESVHVMHNVVALDYISGGGTTIYDARDRDVVAAYSSGAMDDADRKDMFAMLINIEGNFGLPSAVIDITGRFPADILPQGGPLHYDTAPYYSALWGWTTPEVYMDSLTAFTDERLANVRCWQGTQYVWGLDQHGRFSPKAKIRTGGGHFGSSLYHGWVADVCGRGVHDGVLDLMEVCGQAEEAVAL